MRVLFYGETPCIETGAARVDRNILDVIVELGIEVEVIAMSHGLDSYDHERFPFPITGITSHEEAAKLIDEKKHNFDVLFISADMHVPNILLPQFAGFKKTIVLGAIDGVVIHPSQIASFAEADYPVVYSQYSYNQVLAQLPAIQGKFKCITLGCEPETLYPLPEDERRAYRLKAYGIDDSTFLVMNANRNQRRKDMARSMAAFHLFHERVPNSKMYMHAVRQDVGGDLSVQARMLGIDVRNEMIFTGDDYTVYAGYERAVLNKMYNAADVCVSSAQGEGWGLTTTEAMSAGTPFIGPANTTFFELMGANNPGPGERGYLVKSGGPDLWSISYGADDSPRPITSVTDMAVMLYHVYAHREEAREKAHHARLWTLEHTWEQMRDEWRTLLKKVVSELS